MPTGSNLRCDQSLSGQFIQHILTICRGGPVELCERGVLAREEVEQVLRQPRDKRLFLLANEMPDALGRRYLLWSLFHLAVMIGTGVGSLILFGIK